MAKLFWESIAIHCQTNLAILIRHWSRAYSIHNFVRISYTHLLFLDTTLTYYNRMILSKNGTSFIPISHKKSRTKIVTAPHTKFERGFFRCSTEQIPTKNSEGYSFLFRLLLGPDLPFMRPWAVVKLPHPAPHLPHSTLLKFSVFIFKLREMKSSVNPLKHTFSYHPNFNKNCHSGLLRSLISNSKSKFENCQW